MLAILTNLSWRGLSGFVPLALFLTGCASTNAPLLNQWSWRGWISDYESAERQAGERQQPVLFYYKDTRNRHDDACRLIEQVCTDGDDRFVRCILLNSYEPDRRYAAQFGVERSPAMILVHSDGTFHASTGPFTDDSIRAFLARSNPPGLRPNPNPYLPRRAEFAWHTSLRDAGPEARRQDRDLLVVYYRGVSQDWFDLEALLARPEVLRHVAGMVHCREAFWGIAGAEGDTPFGVLALPALVVVRRDNSHQILEQPTSADAVARFVAAPSKPAADREPSGSGYDAAVSSLVESP